MLWKALILWTVLCLAGLVGGDMDYIYWYPGRRKLASINETVDAEDNPINDDHDITNRTRRREENRDEKLRIGPRLMENPNPFLISYLSFTKLNLYNRHKKVQSIKASDWFKDFDYNKDLVILVHGGSTHPEYVEDFFNTMAFALLKNADYNIIGIDWRNFYLMEKTIFDVERNLEELVKIGHVLQSVVERTRNPTNVDPIKTIYIGHGLGNVPVVVQSVTYGYVFDVVYGLAPRISLRSYNYFMLTQMHGRLVNILTTIPYPHSLGHRNFRTVYDENFRFKGNVNFLAYQLLAKAILYGNITARYCESVEAYNFGHCKDLTEIPIWTREMHPDKRIPDGKYYLELPSPKLRRDCLSQIHAVRESN